MDRPALVATMAALRHTGTALARLLAEGERTLDMADRLLTRMEQLIGLEEPARKDGEGE